MRLRIHKQIDPPALRLRFARVRTRYLPLEGEAPALEHGDQHNIFKARCDGTLQAIARYCAMNPILSEQICQPIGDAPDHLALPIAVMKNHQRRRGFASPG